MSELTLVVEAMLPILIVAGLGVALRRLGWLTSAADASLLALTVNVLTPCLIFDKVLGSVAIQRAGTLLLAPSVGFGIVALSVGVAFVGAHVCGLRQEPARRTFALAAGVQNYGYFPLPLALSLFGDETAAVLFVHNLGVEIAIWTLGVAVLAGVPLMKSVRRMSSAPAIAIVLALALNALVGRERIPSYVVQSLALIGSAAIPLGLMLTGATMADLVRGLGGPGSVRTVLLALGLRLGVLPLLYCAALAGLDTSLELERVFALQAAMPAAVLPIVLAKHYGGDSITALRVVVATTVGAFVTIPLWIHFATRWVGGE